MRAAASAISPAPASSHPPASPGQIERGHLHHSLKGLPKVGDGLLLPGHDFGPPAIAVPRLFVEAEIVDQEDPPDRCQGEPRLQDLPEAAVRLPDAEVGGVGNKKFGGGGKRRGRSSFPIFRAGMPQESR